MRIYFWLFYTFQLNLRQNPTCHVNLNNLIDFQERQISRFWGARSCWVSPVSKVLTSLDTRVCHPMPALLQEAGSKAGLLFFREDMTKIHTLTSSSWVYRMGPLHPILHIQNILSLQKQRKGPLGLSAISKLLVLKEQQRNNHSTLRPVKHTEIPVAPHSLMPIFPFSNAGCQCSECAVTQSNAINSSAL
ncbi:hypothetical protein J6590_072702 [Homalodisca vitripennis]|nr:hypothetical protein J6590_072702 [Homalodisca vitripennis]